MIIAMLYPPGNSGRGWGTTGADRNPHAWSAARPGSVGIVRACGLDIARPQVRVLPGALAAGHRRTGKRDARSTHVYPTLSLVRAGPARPPQLLPSPGATCRRPASCRPARARDSRRSPAPTDRLGSRRVATRCRNACGCRPSHGVPCTTSRSLARVLSGSRKVSPGRREHPLTEGISVPAQKQVQYPARRMDRPHACL